MTTPELEHQFLETPRPRAGLREVEQDVTHRLGKFWADVEFRHILKTAQMACGGPGLSVTASLAGPRATARGAPDAEAPPGATGSGALSPLFPLSLVPGVLQGGWGRWGQGELDECLPYVGPGGHRRRRPRESSG